MPGPPLSRKLLLNFHARAGHAPAATTLRWEGRAATKYVLLFKLLLSAA